MAFSKQQIYANINILPDGQMMVRITTQYLEDGVVGAERDTSLVLEPGMDVSALPVKLRQTTQIWWTAQVIADFQAKKAAAKAV